MRKRVVIDTSDGQEYYTAVDLSRKVSRSPFGKRWCKMSLAGYDRLAQFDFTLTDVRVLFTVLSSMENAHQVYVNQASIARHIKSYPPHVSKSLKRLVELDILRKTPGTMGKFTIYHLNPRFAWYGGDNEQHFKSLKEWDRVM